MDAAVIALEVPDHCIRVLWRREEEFGYEPLGTAMQVTARAALDEFGKPVEWTQNLVRDACAAPEHRRQHADARGAADAAARPAVRPIPRSPAVAVAHGTARPLYDFPVRRIVHHLVLAPPVRTARCADWARCRMCSRSSASWTNWRNVPGSIRWRIGCRMLSDPRARRIIEMWRPARLGDRGAAGTGRGWVGVGALQEQGGLCGGGGRVEVEQEVRLKRVWCAADAGLVINPDGARNQFEGGIVQAISMTLKEQMRWAGGTDVAGLGRVSDLEVFPRCRRSAQRSCMHRICRRWVWASARSVRRQRQSATRWRMPLARAFVTCR